MNTFDLNQQPPVNPTSFPSSPPIQAATPSAPSAFSWRPPFRPTDSFPDDLTSMYDVPITMDHAEDNQLPVAPSDNIQPAKSLETQMVLAPTAQHEITRNLLAGESGLRNFAELIIRCAAHNRQFFELAVQVVNIDANTGKADLNDFFHPVHGLEFGAMQEFIETASEGTPRPTNVAEWLNAVQAPIQNFVKANPIYPAKFKDLVKEHMQAMRPLNFGDLDRAYDGLLDYIRGFRLTKADAETSKADPATRLARLLEVEASIRVPGSVERWKSLKDIGEFEPAPFLIDDFLVAGTVGMIFGPPGDGKTFFALDIASSIASGRAWNGSHTEHGGVLFYCLEGGVGFRNRLSALKNKGFLREGDPFEFSTEALDLRSADAQKRILSDIKINELKYKTKVKLIVIDTLAVATSGGNECTSEDMGTALAAIGEVVKSSGMTALLLHHPGKDKSRGPRGWSGIVGNLDTIIEMERGSNGLRTARVTKQKDCEEGLNYTFELEAVTLGLNERQKMVTSCVVRHLTGEEAAKAGGDDHDDTLRRLWVGRSEGEVINTTTVREVLKIEGKGGRSSTRAAEIMNNLEQVGLVKRTKSGANNQRQYSLTPNGIEVVKSSAKCDNPGNQD